MPLKSIISTKFDSILQVLEDVVKQDVKQFTTLIICMSKEDFLSQVIATIQHGSQARQSSRAGQGSSGRDHQLPDEIPASQEDLEDALADVGADTGTGADAVDGDGNGHGDGDDSGDQKQYHQYHLLLPSLHLLSSSRRITLIFTPTVAIYRAYISTFIPKVAIDPETSLGARHDVIVLCLMALHHNTSEFTLQGLSRTLSATVSAAYRSKSSSLRLVECRDVFDQNDPGHGNALWDTSVPLLSGSVKISAAGAGWASRTIAVRKIVSRWFDFD